MLLYAVVIWRNFILNHPLKDAYDLNMEAARPTKISLIHTLTAKHVALVVSRINYRESIYLSNEYFEIKRKIEKYKATFVW